MQLLPVHLAKLPDTATRQAFEASADETELRVILTLGFYGERPVPTAGRRPETRFTGDFSWTAVTFTTLMAAQLFADLDSPSVSPARPLGMDLMCIARSSARTHNHPSPH